MSPSSRAPGGAGDRGERPFAHHSLTLDTARGLAVEEFGGGVVGFRLPGARAGEAEAPAQVTKGGRRKAAG